MAASYQTGTVAGPTALLQALVTWLVAQGWTSDSSASSGAGWRSHLHKNGLYINLRALVGEAGNIATAWGASGARLRFTKANYRHFLRLNDRKTSQTALDLEQAGYRYQIRSRSMEENAGWIKETFGDRAVTFHNMIYFAYEEDLTLYLLRWS